MKTQVARLALLVLLALTLADRLTTAQVATGTPAFGSYGGGPFDTVNLGNLNVHFAIPILHKAGRGIPFTYDLKYDSSVWKPVTASGTTQWYPAPNWGWQNGVLFGYVTYSVGTSDCQYYVSYTGQWYTAYTQYFYTDWAFVDQSGSTHPLTGATQSWSGHTQPGTNCATVPPDIPSATGAATDGSGYTLAISNYTTGTVTSASGRQVTNTSGQTTVADANGNQITSNASGQYLTRFRARFLC